MWYPASAVMLNAWLLPELTTAAPDGEIVPPAPARQRVVGVGTLLRVEAPLSEEALETPPMGTIRPFQGESRTPPPTMALLQDVVQRPTTRARLSGRTPLLQTLPPLPVTNSSFVPRAAWVLAPLRRITRCMCTKDRQGVLPAMRTPRWLWRTIPVAGSVFFPPLQTSGAFSSGILGAGAQPAV